MKKVLIILGIIVFCGATNKKKSNSKEISIEWIDELGGNFSFVRNWSYPEGIYRNEFGQLSCDGFCPPETDKMKDENGKIYADSLDTFYKLVDTTHLFHSIKSEAWAYEWAGTNFITVERINKDTVICFTQNNASTHSSLHLIISKNTVKPTIVLKSINSRITKTYYCKGGRMLIHRGLWNRGTLLKASFYFEFYHEDNANKMYWKGDIFAKIENK
jgi:hypothetical protein